MLNSPAASAPSPSREQSDAAAAADALAYAIQALVYLAIGAPALALSAAFLPLVEPAVVTAGIGVILMALSATALRWLLEALAERRGRIDQHSQP